MQSVSHVEHVLSVQRYISRFKEKRLAMKPGHEDAREDARLLPLWHSCSSDSFVCVFFDTFDAGKPLCVLETFDIWNSLRVFGSTVVWKPLCAFETFDVFHFSKREM